MGEKRQRRDWAQWVRAMVEEAKRKRPGQVGLWPVPAWKATGKTAAMPDDETQRRRTTMKKETQRQHWTQEEVKTAIAKAIEHEPEGPNKDYWASDLTVDAVKRKYRTTKFKPSPWKIVLVRQCCGEKFSHVLANKRQAKGLDDWRCPGV